MKSNSSDTGATKLLCYLGIFILLLFIVLPPLFRVLFPEEEEIKQEETKLIMNLNCVRTENFVEYKIKTTIDTNYIDGAINYSTFTYEIEIVDDMMMSDSIEIEEYDALKKVANVDFEQNENKYMIKIDYSNFDYSNEPLLQEHRKSLQDQRVIYSEDHFECETTKVQ